MGATEWWDGYRHSPSPSSPGSCLGPKWSLERGKKGWKRKKTNGVAVAERSHGHSSARGQKMGDLPLTACGGFLSWQTAGSSCMACVWHLGRGAFGIGELEGHWGALGGHWGALGGHWRALSGHCVVWLGFGVAYTFFL